jgi:hypothetical protein
MDADLGPGTDCSRGCGKFGRFRGGEMLRLVARRFRRAATRNGVRLRENMSGKVSISAVKSEPQANCTARTPRAIQTIAVPGNGACPTSSARREVNSVQPYTTVNITTAVSVVHGVTRLNHLANRLSDGFPR